MTRPSEASDPQYVCKGCGGTVFSEEGTVEAWRTFSVWMDDDAHAAGERKPTKVEDGDQGTDWFDFDGYSHRCETPTCEYHKRGRDDWREMVTLRPEEAEQVPSVHPDQLSIEA